MSVSFPNTTLYPSLSNYAVLASSGITSTVITNIANGYYGSVPTAPNVSGFTVSGSPSGEVNGATATAAQADLAALTNAIGVVAGGRPQTIIGTVTSPIILYPTNVYGSPSTVIFQGIPITLDAQGDPNAQFIIIAGSSMTFNNIPSITLRGGATNCNVFWGTGDGDITFTGTMPPSIPGVFIAGTSITFANGCNVSGRLYAQTGNVTFSGTSFVDATCGVNPDPNPYSNICFPAGTPVQTDQGIVNIDQLDKNIHTIANNKIIAVTNTVSLDKYLICLKKNAIGINKPNQTTIMSKDHKIEFKDSMVPAERFLNYFSDVKKVQYNGEVLYNVLLEKSGKMVINNMVCETLHPENIIAKLYTNGYTDKERTNIVCELNNSLMKRNLPMYKNVLAKINL
jgi:hypothetical protein